MSGTDLSMVAGAISSTSFALLVWGSLLLVAAAFGYIVWSILADRH